MALAATRTWQMVTSGFFPPKPLGLAGQEQVTDLSHREVSHDGVVLADFEVTHAQFVFFVLQRPFHRPAGEADVQDGFDACSRWRVREEVFLLARVRDVARVDEPVGAEDLTVALDPDGGAFEFPDHRSFLGVLEVNLLQRLLPHGRRRTAERFDIAVVGPCFVAWIAGPGGKIAADFDDVALAAFFEPGQERGTGGVPFVGGEPSEGDAIGQGAIDLSQGDVVLGPVDEMVGDAGFCPAVGIVPAVFGKEQIAVEHGAEAGVVAGITQVDADHAVVDLAGVAAPLEMNARGFVAALGMTGIVDDADGLGIRMIPGNELLDAIAQQHMTPRRPTEELLQSPTRRVGEVGDRFDTLARQVRELTANVIGQVIPWLGTTEAVVKLVQKLGEFGRQGKDLMRCHP